jgi:hypothetical protein
MVILEIVVKGKNVYTEVRRLFILNVKMLINYNNYWIIVSRFNIKNSQYCLNLTKFYKNKQ